MKVFIAVLILIFSFQSWTKADDIRDYEIEGISIGDSLLDYFTEEVIIKRSMADYPNSKKFSRFQAPPSKKFENYDTVDFHYETNDPKYIIVSVSGGIFYENDMKACLKKMEVVKTSMLEIFKNAKTYDDGVSPWLGGDKSGKTITAHFYFSFKSGSYVDIACYDWSDEITKEKNYTDHLEAGLFSKVFGEWFRQINKVATNLYVVGVDFRHYQKIHRTLIWANRIAASSSFGDQKLVYYLGGVDAWLKPRFNFDTDISQEENYAYQSVATNMRGFLQNIRNGNSFALINSEIRFPVFKYFMNRPMKSDFIKNFQIVGFGDVGTAWTGKSPYASDNFFNTAVYPFGPENGNSEVRIINQREPIVMGYGAGLRSRLFGYFVRIDWARGIQDGVHLPHMFYWSLCLDF